MAQTVLRANADTDPITFVFPAVEKINVAVHFFDAAGDLVAGGSVEMECTFPTTTHVGPVANPTQVLTLDWTPETSTITIPGGEYRTIDAGAATGRVKLTPTTVTAPGSATQYAVSVSGRALNTAT